MNDVEDYNRTEEARHYEREEIIEMLKGMVLELSKDERLSLPPADVTINAPLALHQLAIESRIAALKSVILKIKERTK